MYIFHNISKNILLILNVIGTFNAESQASSKNRFYEVGINTVVN